jgi:hypothetical protein
MIEFDYMILGVLFALIAGYCRALFECIVLFDSLYEKHGYSEWWSYARFTRNKQGYWQNTFPNDGGHRIKIIEFIFDALACVCLSYSYSLIVDAIIIIITSVVITFALCKSFGFEQTFKELR